MKSTLIKDTTKSERIQLVKQWEETEGCESSGLYYRADPSARRQRGSHHRIVVRGNSRFPDTEIQR